MAVTRVSIVRISHNSFEITTIRVIILYVTKIETYKNALKELLGISFMCRINVCHCNDLKYTGCFSNTVHKPYSVIPDKKLSRY